MATTSEPEGGHEPPGRDVSDRLIPDDLAPEVFRRASRYADAAQEGYEVSALMDAGAAVDLPPQLIERAIREIEADRLQAATGEQVRRKRFQRLLVRFAIALGIAALGLVVAANRLIHQEQRVEAAWAQVENQLERRAALLPRLSAMAETASLRDSHLQEQLRQVRSAVDRASTPVEISQATDRVDALLDRFHRRLAKDPAASRDPLLLALQYEITGAENRLAVERMRYNQAVEVYNRSLRMFPNMYLARWLRLSSRSYFRSDAVGSESLRPGAAAP
jgi:LemA protein